MLAVASTEERLHRRRSPSLTDDELADVRELVRRLVL